MKALHVPFIKYRHFYPHHVLQQMTMAFIGQRYFSTSRLTIITTGAGTILDVSLNYIQRCNNVLPVSTGHRLLLVLAFHKIHYFVARLPGPLDLTL
jgi:hypothetical protein